MKKIILLTFSVLMIAGLAWATNSVNSIEDTRICERQTQIDSSAPVRVAYYIYDYRTGKSNCQGFGYVRTENGKMLIYIEGEGDFSVKGSNLQGFQYMFNMKNFRGQYTNYYFNM